MQLSIVIPVYNEAQTISVLLDEVTAVLADHQIGAEVIVVDDGSTDETGQILERWQSRHPHHRLITLKKNSGQGAALYTGLHAATGATIVTLDGDGQNAPSDIPALLAELEHADLVVGIRVGRRDTWVRRWMSKVANAVRSRLLGDNVSDSGCALKAMRREVVGALIPIQTLYSFIPALVAGAGFRVRETPVSHRERLGGTSHYSLGKMLWRPLVDMVGLCWFNRRRCNANQNASKRPGIATAALLATAFFLFVGNHGLLEPDEGRYAEVASEMAHSGNLLVPTLNGFSHVEKPPLIYWATALGFRVFGESEFSARLPSTLAALGIIFLTFQIGHQLGGRRTGWIAALVLASSLQFFLTARLLTADMMMAFWITAAIASLVRFHSRPSSSLARWLFFVFMGLGFLTKGPMACVVPLAAATGLAWRNPQRPRLPWLAGLPLSLAIALSWFLTLSIRNPELFHYFLGTELKDRFLSTGHGRSQPFWFFLPVLAGGFLPWTLFLAPALLRFLRRRPPWTPASRLLLAWVALPLLVLSLSGSKLVTYVLPLFPALALGLALAITNGFQLGRATLRTIGVAAIAAATALLVWGIAAPTHLHLNAHLLSILAISAAGTFLLFTRITPTVPSLQRTSGLARASIVIWLAVASQVGNVNHLLGRQASMRPIASTLLERNLPPDTRIIAANLRAHGLEFYLGRVVEITEGQADHILSPSPQQRGRLHHSSETVSHLAGNGTTPVFVVTRSADWKKHFQPDGRWTPVTSSGDFVLLELVSPPPSQANHAGSEPPLLPATG